MNVKRFLCAFLIAAACGAEVEVDLSDGLSAQEAVVLALRRNPELLAMRKGPAVAEANVAGAALLPSPEIRAAVQDIGADPYETGGLRNNVGLRWSPPRPWESGIKKGIARSRLQEVSSGIAAAEQKLAAEVRLLHHTVCLLDEQIRIGEQAAEVRGKILEIVRAQVRAGTRSALEAGMAELTASDARESVERYRLERRVQMGRLAAKLDLPRSQQPELQVDRASLDSTAPVIECEKLIREALENRPEPRAAAERCSQASLAEQSASRERYPWISFVQVSHRFGRLEEIPSWGIQVGVELPIFKWRGDAVRSSSAELAQCRLQQQAVKAGIAAEVDELILRLEASSRAAKEHRDDVVRILERDVALAKTALAEGEADATEPLLAEARQLSARQTFLSKLMDLRALEVGLEQALGAAIR